MWIDFDDIEKQFDEFLLIFLPQFPFYGFHYGRYMSNYWLGSLSSLDHIPEELIQPFCGILGDSSGLFRV